MDKVFTIGDYIEYVAGKYGNQPALTFKTPFRIFTYTYNQLLENSRQVAVYLAGKGIKKGDRVVIWTYNGLEFCSIFLGCAMSGVIMIPVDFGFQTNFIEKIVKTTNVKLVFYSRRKPVPVNNIPTVAVEDLDQQLQGLPSHGIKVKVFETDILEIMYTSGTTSDPKGVIITHKNIMSNLKNILQALPLPRKKHGLLSVLPLTHMFEQTAGFLSPLYYGAEIVYIYSRKPGTIIETLQQKKVTIMIVVPVFLSSVKQEILKRAPTGLKGVIFKRSLLVAQWLPWWTRRLLFRGVLKKLGGHLELFISGGASLDTEIAGFWSNLGIKVIQGYGLTETSPVITLNTTPGYKPGSVGKCLPNQDLKLGPCNEIWVKGDNVTTGYLHTPEEYKNKFEDGWFKTGDVGVIDQEGYLFIQGRLKDIILSPSGLNVFPQDIENVLNNMQGIRDSCVIGLEENNTVKIHAVLLMDRYKLWTEDDIRSMVNIANQSLQPYQKIQGYSLWTEEDFPRTNTLKTKRNQVKITIEETMSSHDLPSHRTGDKVVDLVATFAKLNPTSIKPGYKLVSDLGLDSMARLELAILLEEEFNVEIDDNTLTPDTTIEDIKNLVKTRPTVSRSYSVPRWATRFPARVARSLLQTVVFRMPSLFSITTVEGKDRLKTVNPPVIFISNHVSFWDTVFITRALPRRLRKLAIATAIDFVFDIDPNLPIKQKLTKKLKRFVSILVMNSYPFSRKSLFKKSFEYTGKLLDENWNILYFPEGELTKTGNMLPFKPGIGLIVQNMKVPVVPIKLEGIYDITNFEGMFPKKLGRVRIIFGDQIQVNENQDPGILAKLFENTIKNLG